MDIDYKEIASQIRRTLAGRGITMNKAAEMLDITPQALNKQLSGRTISKRTASEYSRVFGFNVEYMLTGIGTLSGDSQLPVATQVAEGVVIPRETLQMYTSMAQSIENLTTIVNKLMAGTPLKKGESYHDIHCPQNHIKQ